MVGLGMMIEVNNEWTSAEIDGSVMNTMAW